MCLQDVAMGRSQTHLLMQMLVVRIQKNAMGLKIGFGFIFYSFLFKTLSYLCFLCLSNQMEHKDF